MLLSAPGQEGMGYSRTHRFGQTTQGGHLGTGMQITAR